MLLSMMVTAGGRQRAARTRSSTKGRDPCPLDSTMHDPIMIDPPCMQSDLVAGPECFRSYSFGIVVGVCIRLVSKPAFILYANPVSRPLQLTRTSDLPAGGQSLIDLKSTYCFGAHMHEIMKYFLFTENQ